MDIMSVIYKAYNIIMHIIASLTGLCFWFGAFVCLVNSSNENVLDELSWIFMEVVKLKS